MRMNAICKIVALMSACAGVCAPAQAGTLACEGGIASEGESRVALVYKCGQPVLRDTFCAPIYYKGSRNPVPEPIASHFVPCVDVEEWVYERGPGNLVATVRLRGGKVQSITYGRAPT
jgi:Protein of unknown function (DUF2845)